MKPPRRIYLLCLAAWTGLIFTIAARINGNYRRDNVVGTLVMLALCLYFSFFAVKRLRYDRLPTGKANKFMIEVGVQGGQVCQLHRIEGNRNVKLRLKLVCKHYESDESFPVQIIDKHSKVVTEEAFVPAFGRFCLETEIAGELLPGTVVLKNTSNRLRTINSRINYAEIIA